jgi:phage tail sheath gpL-like
MTISFNQVPNGIRVPFAYIEFDNTGALTGTALQTYRALLIAPRTSGGSVQANTLTRVTSAQQARGFFGPGSVMHNMAEAYFANNTFTETWAIAVDDNVAHVAATGSIVITGTPSVAGTLCAYIAGRLVQVGVTTASTATTIATALAAAINANTNLPVTASSATGTVTITAKNKGALGNGIDLRLNYAGESTPAGLTVTVNAMASGTGNPDLSGIFTAIAAEQFHIWAQPYNDAATLTSIETELSARSGPLRQQDGMCFTAVAGNFAAATTLGAGRNSQFNSIMATNGSPNPVWEVAGAVAANAAYYGQIDPARPFKTLPLTSIKAGDRSVRFTLSERDQLLKVGISTHVVTADGTVQIERLITTYQTNPLGAADISYLDVNTLLTLSYLRFDTRILLLTKYPRHKLASDGTRYGPGQAIVTPKVVKAELINRARQWEELGLVENADGFKAGLIVERNAQDPSRLDILLTPDLINQLQVMGVQIKFILQ